MFEIELDPQATVAHVVSSNQVVRLVLPPHFPFEDALSLCRDDLVEAATRQLREIFSTRECPREFSLESDRLIIRRSIV